MLATLARAATRRPLTVISVWVLFLLLGFGLGTGVFGRLSDNVPEVPGTESELAADYLDRVDPTGETVTGVVEAVAVSDPTCAPRSKVRSPMCATSPGSPPCRTRTPRAASPRGTGGHC